MRPFCFILIDQNILSNTYSFFLLDNTATIHPHELDVDQNFSISATQTLDSVCHATSDSSTNYNMKNVIVFGGASFLGSRIAMKGHMSGYNVYPVEDIINRFINYHTWHRWDLLKEQGFQPLYLNGSSNSEVHSILKECQSGTIVYIPSIIFDGVNKRSKLSIDLTDSSALLQNFIYLLELLMSDYKDKYRIVLVSLSNAAGLSVQKAWLKTFENSLSVYNHMYGLNSIFIRIDGLFGDWQDPIQSQNSLKSLHIKKFEDEVFSTFKIMKSCIEKEIRPETKSNVSIDNDQFNKTSRHEPKKNVILSTYFTKSENSMYTIIPNKFYFLKQWFLSARKYGAFLVIFHDELSIDFQDSIKKFYPLVEFVKQESLHGWSANDFRFYLEYNYILQHPEIDKVLLTDMRDVKFFADPFEKMKVIGDYIYIGVDVTYLVYSYELEWIQSTFTVCSKQEDHHFMELHPFLNAGLVGGTRHATLSYLILLNHYLKHTPKFNCNMLAVNFVTNKFFHSTSFSGYPLQQGFKLGTAPSQDLAVKHKDTGELYS